MARPNLHYPAKQFNKARSHAKDHGNSLIKYKIGKSVFYYSGDKLPQHIAKKATDVETKKV